ncbi:PAS domain S-box protein, partial [bacterium]|nr:PAS domain S-box protein [bacterium]
RNQAQEALRESEERFSLFMDYFPECAFIKDQETRTLFVNKYMNDIFGAKEWLGKTVFELFPSDVAEKMMADDRITLDSGYRTAIEEIPDKNGVIHIYETYKFKLNRQNKPPLLGGIALDITERKHAEEQIKKSLKEKEVLLKEIHHRVKNNMQIISSLLNLQSRYIKGKKALEMFKNSQARIRAMALVHERLYRSQDLARINFVEYVQDLVRQLFMSYGISTTKIKFNIRIKDVFLNINKAIPCSLIINELVSNSLKHAFPEGEKGKIDIDFCLGKDNKLLLKIRDNGIGLLDKIDFKNTKTLGLQLVTTLVEQLNGTIEVDIKRGTTFKIRFDKSEGK